MQPQSSLFRRPETANQHTTGVSSSTAASGAYGSARHGAGEMHVSASPGNLPSVVSAGPAQASLSYRGGGAAPTAPNVTHSQEEENDELIKALLHDVRRAKHKFTGLGEEVKKQNSLLEQLEGHFREARTVLHKTIQRLDAASGASGFKHMWLLFLFVIVFFMFIYLLLKFRR